MPRITPIATREGLSPEGERVFDELMQSRGEVQGPFQILMHRPEICARIAQLGSSVRKGGLLDAASSELAILTAARAHNAQLAWTGHVPIARRVGVREEAIVAIRERTAPAGLTQKEAAVVAFAQELLQSNRVTEPTYRAAERELGQGAVIDLVVLLGYYGMMAAVMNVFEVPPMAGVEPLRV